jgi:hypothetical protein
VKLVLANPESRPTLPKPEVFDLKRLLANYKVRDVRSLDDPPQADVR